MESNARKHGLRTAVRRMERSGISSAFAAWLQWSVESRTLRAAASRVILRLQNAALSSAYGRWCEYWSQCRLVRRVATRISNLRMSQSFGCWIEAVDLAISTREQTNASQSLALLREEVEAQAQRMNADTMKKALAKIEHVKVSAAMAAWAAYTSAAVGQRSALERAVAMLRNMKSHAAWRAWVDFASSSKRMRETAARVIGRLQHSAVLGAFMAWSDHTRWSVRSRKIVGRMLSRWQMKEVSACFMAWCDDVRSSHLRVHTAICRSAAIVTSDPAGHARAEAG